MRDSNDSPTRPGTSLMQEIGNRVLSGLRDAVVRSTAQTQAPLSTPAEEPPVVAQLMIEIRSDGSRTIARGALNDLRTHESANVHAEGRTPGDLMVSLIGSLLSLPSSTFNMLRSRELGEHITSKPKKDS
jgi:hypothetical protein